MNYKCICIISLIFSSLDPPRNTILSTEEEIYTRLLKLHVPANIFSVLRTTTLKAVKVTPDLLL